MQRKAWVIERWLASFSVWKGSGACRLRKWFFKHVLGKFNTSSFLKQESGLPNMENHSEIIKMKPLDKPLTMCFHNLNLTFVAVLSSATERNYYDFLQQASKIHLAKRNYSAASSDSWQHSHLTSDTFRFLVWLRDRLVFPACNHCWLYEKKFLCNRKPVSGLHRTWRRNQFLFPLLLRIYAPGCTDFLSFSPCGNGMVYSGICNIWNPAWRRTSLLLAAQEGFFGFYQLCMRLFLS